MPRQMLMYRAASFWTSVYAPELSMGMRTVEESQDMGYDTQDAVFEELNAEKEQHANAETISLEDDDIDDNEGKQENVVESKPQQESKQEEEEPAY